MIICLSHSGITKDKKGGWTGEDVKLAKKVKGIDLIISAHIHVHLKEPVIVKGVPIVVAGDNGRFVGRIELIADGGRVKLDRYESIPVDDNLSSQPGIQAAIDEQQGKIIDIPDV